MLTLCLTGQEGSEENDFKEIGGTLQGTFGLEAGDTCEKDGVIGRAAHQPESEGDIGELVEGGHHHAEHQDGEEVPREENHQGELYRDSHFTLF